MHAPPQHLSPATALLHAVKYNSHVIFSMLLPFMNDAFTVLGDEPQACRET